MFTESQENPLSISRWLLFAFQIAATCWTGFAYVGSMWMPPPFPMIAAALFLGCTISLVFRLGWIIPFVAVGTMLTVETGGRMDDMVVRILPGAFCGLIFGTLAETACRGSLIPLMEKLAQEDLQKKSQSRM